MSINLVESNADALRADRVTYDPKNPDSVYTIPHRNAHQAQLMQAGEEGKEQEGFLEYYQDRVQYLVTDERGYVALVRTQYALQKEPLLVLPGKDVETTDSFESLPDDAVQVYESLANAKYHTKKRLTFTTSDLSVLPNEGVIWVDISTPEAIDRFMLENMAHADASCIATFYKRKMELLGHEVVSQLPVFHPPEGVTVRPMQPETGNWFQMQQVNENGKRVEKGLNNEEVLAAALTVHGLFVIMREKLPALSYNRSVLLPGGGWRSDEDSSANAVVRELQEEVDETGDAFLLGVLHANPEFMNNGSHIHLVTGLRENTDPVDADELEKPIRDEIHPDELIDLINAGEVVDDRVVAGLAIAMVWLAANRPHLLATRE